MFRAKSKGAEVNQVYSGPKLSPDMRWRRRTGFRPPVAPTAGTPRSNERQSEKLNLRYGVRSGWPGNILPASKICFAGPNEFPYPGLVALLHAALTLTIAGLVLAMLWLA